MIDVTVVIPVYNGEKTIKRCLESVLCQTISNIEIIVVNDGSTDKTEGVVKSFNDTRIKLITTENRGQGFARNIGIQAAKGKYIGFVDADDTIEEDMYEIMFSEGLQNKADVVQCAINDIKSDIASIRPVTQDEVVRVTDIADYTSRYFYPLIHTNEVCNKIFSAEFLQKCGVVFSDTKEFFSEDLKFNIDILSHITSIVFVKKALYNYYISDLGHCRNNSPHRVEKIFNLYIASTDTIANKTVQHAIRSMAVVNVLLYSVPVIDKVKQIICSKTMKKFMLCSCAYKKTVRHTLLMLALILLPYSLKKKLIVRQYTF